MNRYSIDSNHGRLNDKNPFSDDRSSGGAWEKLAKTLTQISCSDHDPLTVSVEAPWGSGKTFFLRRFGSMLAKPKDEGIKNKIQVIWINAWEADYVTDPFEVLIHHFSKAFPETTTEKDFKRTAGIVLKNISTGLLDQMFKKYVGTELNMEAVLKEVSDVDYFQNSQKRFESFEKGKKQLAEIIESKLKQSKEIGVVIIDELDRCHPRFAVEFLERVKHFFGISHLKFIFGIDHDQLCHLVKGHFGSELDAANYLNRFFNLRIQLPVKHSGASGIVLDRFSGLLDEGTKAFAAQKDIGELCGLIDNLTLSTRQKQLLACKLALAFRYISGIKSEQWCTIALGIYLNEKEQGLFKHLFSERILKETLLHEVIDALIKHTQPVAYGANTNLDEFCAPNLLCVLFGYHEVKMTLARWLGKNTYPEFTEKRLVNNARLTIWKNRLEGNESHWNGEDRSLIARVATLTSTLQV